MARGIVGVPQYQTVERGAWNREGLDSA
jgi:hypothetical protein